MNGLKIDEKSKRHLYIFEPTNEEIDEESEKYYDESALLPIEDETPFLKGKTCEMELSLKLKQLERIFESNNRYYYALQKIEHAVRYLQGYLGDYTVTVRRELKRDKIKVIIEVEPFDELNSIEKLREKMRREVKRILPELPDEKVEELVNRLSWLPSEGDTNG